MLKEIAIRKKLDREVSALVRRSGRRDFFPKDEIGYAELLSNRMAIIWIISEGVPYSLFHLIQNLTPFSEKDWSVFLDISTKTLQRFRLSSKHFKPIHSEKIIELAEVTQAGTETFGSLGRFKLWLNTPNHALGGTKPLELLSNSYGKEMVLGELTRIDHGILA